MLAVHEKEIIESKKFSIRYDNSTRTYYCFYHRIDNLSLELILSYDLNEGKWNIDTIEYKDLFEKHLNDLFYNQNIPFEEQVRYIIDSLDTYFADQKIKINILHHHGYSVPWFRRLRGMRRSTSHSILTDQSAVLQRYSAPEKSTFMDGNEEIISVKALAESFYRDDSYGDRINSTIPTTEYLKEHVPPVISNIAPSITEIWLNVTTAEFQTKTGSQFEEDILKKLAEKFVTYFGGTFQCNIGHQYQLQYESQIWTFIILKVEFMTNQTSETTKLPKSKIIFLINGIPHHVRG